MPDIIFPVQEKYPDDETHQEQSEQHPYDNDKDRFGSTILHKKEIITNTFNIMSKASAKIKIGLPIVYKCLIKKFAERFIGISQVLLMSSPVTIQKAGMQSKFVSLG